MPINARPGTKRPALVPLVLNPLPPRRSTPTPAPDQREDQDDFTVLPDVSPSSISPPPTPRMQRVKDMVGEENIDNLPFLLSKLKNVMLRVPKSQIAQRSVVSSLAEGYKENQADFLCARSEFVNAMTLIDICTSIASKAQTHSPPPSLQTLHAKLDVIIENQKSAPLLLFIREPRTPKPPPLQILHERL